MLVGEINQAVVFTEMVKHKHQTLDQRTQIMFKGNIYFYVLLVKKKKNQPEVA